MEYHDFILPHQLHFQKNSSTSVLHLNARSAANKQENISNLLNLFCFKFDIIMLTETWYQDSNSRLYLDGYADYVLNRIDKRGGGVAIYIASGQKYELLADFCKTTCDYEMLTLQHLSDIISVVYRPPNGNVFKFMSFFDNLLEYVAANEFRLVCGGDTNINFLVNSAVSVDFTHRLSSGGFVNLINTPTRVTLSSSTCLDILITNIDTVVEHTGTVTSDVSDHCPVFMTYCANAKKTFSKSNVFAIQDLSEKNMDLFKHDISKYDWSFLYEISDVNVAYSKFLSAFLQIYNLHFPFKKLRQTRKIRKPWITQELFKMIKHKDKLYHSFLATRSPEVLIMFKKYRNKLNAQLRRARIAYHERMFTDATGKHPDILWNIINKVLGREKHSAAPEKLIHNKTEISGLALANHFNEYFASISAVQQPQQAPPNTSSFLSTPNSLFLNPTNEYEVFTTFKNLKNSKALDIDDIQIKPVKYVLEYIAPALTHIFNLALQYGIFPEKMKMSRVTVIFKGGDRNDTSNYRPISIIPVFSKGLEKIIFSRVSSFFDRHSVLSDAQFGFRKGRSTETALLTLKEYVLKNIERNLFTLALFIDFSKAFDCINHKILLWKLSQNGLRGIPLTLFESYLTDRKQSVCIRDEKSCFLPIINGVPQGSVLGPLLFNVYVNDITNITTSVQFIIYADDTTLLVSGPDSQKLIRQCNDLLVKLSQWSIANCLKINPTKTKVMLFRAKNKSLTCQQTLLFAGKELQIVDEHKLLGVTFSSHLTWDKHVENICKKLSAITGALSRCRYLLPPKAKLNIYYALFFSHLSYCSLVWGTTGKTNIMKLFLLQKRMIRHIDNMGFLETTRPAFLNHRIIKIEHLYTFRLLYSFYFSKKYLHNFLASTASLTPRITSANTRNSDMWYVPRFRNNYRLQSLEHNLPHILNKYKDVKCFSAKELRTLFVNM